MCDRNSACDFRNAELLHLGPPWCWLPMNESPEGYRLLLPQQFQEAALESVFIIVCVSCLHLHPFSCLGNILGQDMPDRWGKIKQSKVLVSSKVGSVTTLAETPRLPCQPYRKMAWKGKLECAWEFSQSCFCVICVCDSISFFHINTRKAKFPFFFCKSSNKQSLGACSAN